ncbi:MAG: type IVB secretion system protein DotG/IcmE [Legionellaceae bacterium]|nr:type IVB secretion system protein DotG/IcmE [Legionellaceae bacterium]MBP9774545.1 type IVB secretion system protein DotG/IcmE [Legionellaceae bacterium]
MATKKENIKSLFTNSRSRIIIIFTAILVVTMIVIGFVKLHSSSNPLKEKSGVVRGAAGIKSIPGSLNQTAQYAALQETQNMEQAKDAAAKGGSAIPTIIRSQAFGDGVESVGAQGGEGSVGFSTLARENLEGPQSTIWFQNLKDQHCNPASLAKAIEAGAILTDLKKVCTCEQLKRKGFSLPELKQVCPCPELRALGFSSQQFKAAGYCAAELKVCGFTACEEHSAGFSADEMKNAGFSDGEMSGAGFSERDIARAGGLPDGIKAEDIRKEKCSPEALRRWHGAGVSAAAIRQISGCTAAALKAAGYTALELKNAGFSAAELKNSGFTPDQLRQAGYSARDLMDAGFSAADLAAGGFSSADIGAAEMILPVGFTTEDVRKAGCSEEAIKRQRLAGVSAAAIKKLAGCSPSALLAGGFTMKNLENAGFRPEELTDQALVKSGMLDNSGVSDADLKTAGCDPAKLKEFHNKGVNAARIHCSAEALKAAGYNAQQLTAAGFTPAQLQQAGFSATDIAAAQALLKAGLLDGSTVSDTELQTAGCDPAKLKEFHNKGVNAARIHCSAEALKAAGYNAQQLTAAGFTPAQLQQAGFSATDIAAAQALLGGLIDDGSGVSDTELQAAGCDPAKLKKFHDKGVNAARIKCSVEALRKAGYSTQALAGIGFTPAQLLAAGFSPEDLKAAGMAITPAGLIAAGRTAGCSVEALVAARKMGLTAKTIKNTLGCDVAALRAAGFSATDLKEAGFTAAELKNAGFSATDLKAAGYSAKDLKAAGFSATELKAAGYDASNLKDAGFTAADLKAAGFSAADLKTAGYTAAELKAGGYSAVDLKTAGYSAAELKAAGVTAAEMKAAGFTNDQLQAAGFSPHDSALAGLADMSPNAGQTMPSIVRGAGALNKNAQMQAANAQKLEKILAQQKVQMADQKYQQKIQQRTATMTNVANQLIQAWKIAPIQAYVGGGPAGDENGAGEGKSGPGGAGAGKNAAPKADATVVVKMGDVMFAVIDTSVNSDEPGPILATIVSGPLKGAKLIGSFNLPAEAEKMVISFNAMSVPGAPKTLSIAAFAIDPDTARTALSSETNHHYMSRYGALFASTFLEGFGNAFQSADTTITIGGTGDTQQTTVQNGIGRSSLENAVIGLATVGKAWGQYAQQGIKRKPTVEVFSGTGVGILFTQDVKIM